MNNENKLGFEKINAKSSVIPERTNYNGVITNKSGLPEEKIVKKENEMPKQQKQNSTDSIPVKRRLTRVAKRRYAALILALFTFFAGLKIGKNIGEDKTLDMLEKDNPGITEEYDNMKNQEADKKYYKKLYKAFCNANDFDGVFQASKEEYGKLASLANSDGNTRLEKAADHMYEKADTVNEGATYYTGEFGPTLVVYGTKPVKDLGGKNR